MYTLADQEGEEQIMDQSFDIQEYMTQGVGRVVGDIVKATFRNPRESAYMAKFALACRTASRKRRKAENAGEEFRWLHAFPNYCVHYMVPLLSLLNWLLFAVKSELNYAWAVIWTVIPWIYVVYAMIMGHSGKIIENTDSAYPYDFMDVGRHGWKIVARNCALVVVVFVAAGLLLIFLGKLI